MQHPGRGPVPQEGHFSAGAAVAPHPSRCVCTSRTAQPGRSSRFSTAALPFPPRLLRLPESSSRPAGMQSMNRFTSTPLNNWCMKYVSIGTPTAVS